MDQIYLEMGNSLFQEVRGGLEICIEDGNKLIVLDIAAVHGRLEIPSLVAISDDSMPVDDSGAVLLPFQHLVFDQYLSRGVI